MTNIYTGTGIIQKQTVGGGDWRSKSRHEAIVLKTDAGDTLRLRLRGGSSFDYTPFEKFLGQRVQITGEQLKGMILEVDSLNDITPVKRGPRSPQPG